MYNFSFLLQIHLNLKWIFESYEVQNKSVGCELWILENIFWKNNNDGSAQDTEIFANF